LQQTLRISKYYQIKHNHIFFSILIGLS